MPSVAVARPQLNKRLKDVQDFLRAGVGDSFSLSEVREGTGHDLRVDDALVQRLRGAAFVCFELEDGSLDSHAARLRYRPRNNVVRDRVTLLNFIRDNPCGTFREAVEDCYKGARAGGLARRF